MITLARTGSRQHYLISKAGNGRVATRVVSLDTHDIARATKAMDRALSK